MYSMLAEHNYVHWTLVILYLSNVDNTNDEQRFQCWQNIQWTLAIPSNCDDSMQIKYMTDVNQDDISDVGRTYTEPQPYNNAVGERWIHTSYLMSI